MIYFVVVNFPGFSFILYKPSTYILISFLSFFFLSSPYRPDLLGQLSDRPSARARFRTRSDLGQAQVLSDSIIVVDHSKHKNWDMGGDPGGDIGGDKEKGGDNNRRRARSRSDIGIITTTTSVSGKSPPPPAVLDTLIASAAPPPPPLPLPPPATAPLPITVAPPLPPAVTIPLPLPPVDFNSLPPSSAASSPDLSPFISHPFNTTNTTTMISPTPSYPTATYPTPSYPTPTYPTPTYPTATTIVSPSPRIDKAVALIRSSASTPLSTKNHGTPPPSSTLKFNFSGVGGPPMASPYPGRKVTGVVSQGPSLLLGGSGSGQGPGQGQGSQLGLQQLLGHGLGPGQGQGPGHCRSTVRSSSVPTRSSTNTNTNTGTATLPIRVPTKTTTTTTTGTGTGRGAGTNGAGYTVTSSNTNTPFSNVSCSLSTSRSSAPLLVGSLGTSTHLPDLNLVTVAGSGSGGSQGLWGSHLTQMGVALSNRSSEPCLAALSMDSNSTHSYTRQSPAQSQSHSQSTHSHSSSSHSHSHSHNSQTLSLGHSHSSQSLSKSSSQPPSLAQSLQSLFQSPPLAMSLCSPGSSNQSAPLTIMHAPRPSYAYELNPRPMDQQSKLYFQSRITPPSSSTHRYTASPGLGGGGVLRPSSNSPPVPVHSVVQVQHLT